ncbi:MAG: sigma 54-dependent transcriptional regulator, partial [Rhizobacter sp.]
PGEVQLDALLTEEVRGALDLFDRLQLEAVVRVCRTCGSLSEAGRRLFDHSRLQRSVVNDADRLRKYLQRYGLAWSDVAGR